MDSNVYIANSKYPLVTIITVSYNAIDSIEETILNVINQSYPNIEYIIIDGGSTDGTVDVIKKYAYKISYWISEPDRGIYDAMNKGIKLTTGEWINFMNAGDSFYSLDTISNISMYFNEDYNLVYGKTNMCFAHGTFIRDCSLRTTSNPMPFVHQSSFCRTELLKKHPFSLNYRYAADYDFFCRVFKITIACDCHEIISTYALDGVSSNNSIKVNKERIKANPCLANYWTQVLCYRNFIVKKILYTMRIDIEFVKGKIYKNN